MPWTRDPDGVEARALAEAADLQGRRVLEVGCGDGRLTWTYASRAASVLGVDPSEESVAAARAALPPELAGRVRFVAADIQELELPPAGFDVALLSWSL